MIFAVFHLSLLTPEINCCFSICVRSAVVTVSSGGGCRCSSGFSFSGRTGCRWRCRWRCRGRRSGAAFLVRFVFAVAFSIATVLLINTFAAAALEIAVGTHCRQTLIQAGNYKLQSSNNNNNTPPTSALCSPSCELWIRTENIHVIDSLEAANVKIILHIWIKDYTTTEPNH